jgi:hypothetical protein
MQRVAFAFSKVFRDLPYEFIYCPVPDRYEFVKRDGWWKRLHDRQFVITEMMKLIGYRIVLVMPGWASRRLMRLADPPAQHRAKTS